MEMVSTSKLKRAQDRVVGARPYAAALPEAMAPLLGRGGPERQSFLRQPPAAPLPERRHPLYVRNQVSRALVETAAGEQGARRTAMKNASDAAGDMLDILRRTYNRARQAQITQ